MGTKRKSRKKHSRGRSSLNSKLYAILSGRSHRVVARAKKLTTARRRAAGLVKRGSKHVSIRRGTETFAIGAVKRKSKRRTSKRRSSKRRSSKGVRRNSRRSRRRVSRNSRRSRRRVSRNGRRSRRRVSRNGRRRSKRRVSKNGHRRSKRRVSRNSRRSRHSRR